MQTETKTNNLRTKRAASRPLARNRRSNPTSRLWLWFEPNLAALRRFQTEWQHSWQRWWR